MMPSEQNYAVIQDAMMLGFMKCMYAMNEISCVGSEKEK
jgi:hypothetical protein